MSGDFPVTTAFLEQDVDDGRGLTGVQIEVRSRGELVFSLALGKAGTTPVSVDTVFRVYCALKPVTAVAVAKLVDRGLVDLDEPLSSLLPSVRVLAEDPLTLRHVMTHTAGLHVPTAREVELLRPEMRREFFEQIQGVKPWRIGRDAGYSEAFGWHLLGRMVEVVTGEPLRDHLRASVLDPLQMTSTWIGMTGTEYAANHQRVGINYYYEYQRSQPVPLMIEQSERWCREVNCAYGGYTTAGDMARFYAALAARLNGADAPNLPSAETLAHFCADARPATYDAVLLRECSYGLGFMTTLRDHFFGNLCSGRSFAHSGWMGGAFGFADPDRDLAVGVIINRIVGTETAIMRRPGLVRAVYEDLGFAHERSVDSKTEPEDSAGPDRTQSLGGFLAQRRQRAGGRRLSP